MSIIGDASKASSPFIVRMHLSTLRSCVTQRAMGFGRDGLLQAKTPFSTFKACFFGVTSRVRLSFSLSFK